MVWQKASKMAKQNPISSLLNGVVNDYFDDWTGVHFLFNLGIVWTLSKFFDDWTSAVATLSIAVAWEVYEYYSEGVEPYGNFDNYMRNTISDLLVALMCIGVVLV